ncbi:hypothetical protein RUM43_008753 [Polyplax serrata]|uniref:Uncharacterized protein n=1 Tax=Polyplax serrata TaxID=468196 RepID=A0AAN8NUU4_POLSC
MMLTKKFHDSHLEFVTNSRVINTCSITQGIGIKFPRSMGGEGVPPCRGVSSMRNGRRTKKSNQMHDIKLTIKCRRDRRKIDTNKSKTLSRRQSDVINICQLVDEDSSFHFVEKLKT